MQDRMKDAEYIPKPKRRYVVVMLIREERYYYERFTVEAESAAHAVHQVITYLRDHSGSCDWENFEFKGVEEVKRK